MKLVVNEKHIKTRRTLAMALTFGTLAILVLALLASFSTNPTYRMLSYIGLAVGLVTSQIGMFFTNRYGRNPRFDEILAANFDKLPREYSFWVFASPQPMLLLGPCGFWLPLPINGTGEISYRDGKWRQKGGNFIMKLFGQEGIGNPSREAEAAVAALRKWLADQGLPQAEQPAVKPILIAFDKRTILGELGDAPQPVLQPDDVKQYIRRMDNTDCTTPLDDAQREKLNQLLLAYNK